MLTDFEKAFMTMPGDAGPLSPACAAELTAAHRAHRLIQALVPLTEPPAEGKDIAEALRVALNVVPALAKGLTHAVVQAARARGVEWDVIASAVGGGVAKQTVHSRWSKPVELYVDEAAMTPEQIAALLDGWVAHYQSRPDEAAADEQPVTSTLRRISPAEQIAAIHKERAEVSTGTLSEAEKRTKLIESYEQEANVWQALASAAQAAGHICHGFLFNAGGARELSNALFKLVHAEYTSHSEDVTFTRGANGEVWVKRVPRAESTVLMAKSQFGPDLKSEAVSAIERGQADS